MTSADDIPYIKDLHKLIIQNNLKFEVIKNSISLAYDDTGTCIYSLIYRVIHLCTVRLWDWFPEMFLI